VRDPRTGKSREIDLIAEYYDRNTNHEGAYVKTYFVVEVINNRFPFVLLTQRPSSPNEDFENYVKFACTPEPNEFYAHFDVYEDRQPERSKLFSQFCVLTPKRGEKKELMASHSEDLYSSFQKVAEYIDDELTSWAEMEGLAEDTIWRMFFWHPMLILGGQLVAATTNKDGTTELHETQAGFIEFNWHAGDERRTTVIEVATANAFLDRLSAIVESDARMQEKLHHLRASQRVILKPEP